MPSCDVTNSCFVDSSVTRKLPPPVLSASRNGGVGADCVFLLLKSCGMLYFRRIRTGKILKPYQYCEEKERSVLALCSLPLSPSLSALTLMLGSY